MNQGGKMQKQQTNKGRGIEYVHYTHNIVAGCQHDCHWTMPDGQSANCYAEDIAEGVASPFYPQGFAHHYWHPNRIEEPLKVKEPARIFNGSMADVFGWWVPEWQIQQILDMCERAHWHTFLFLTKNPLRYRDFKFPPNVWLGASVPPSEIKGKKVTLHKQEKFLDYILDILAKLPVAVRWLSIEPFSWDMSIVLNRRASDCIQWAVVGAASRGNTYYQPDPQHLRNVLSVLDGHKTKVFFKGNLKPSLGTVLAHWREEYPQELRETKH